MGNRAVITASKSLTEGVGIYLHWNGGLESVQAFLDVANARGFRDPSGDETYAMARLVGLIHEFFGTQESVSLGIGMLSQLDCNNHDNGVYVIGKDWKIVDRWGKGSRPYSSGDEHFVKQDPEYIGIVEWLTNKKQEA